MQKTLQIQPENFVPENHWYEKAINATIHPAIKFFFGLSNKQIVERYCHLNPKVSPQELGQILSYKPKHYLLSGADLLHVTTKEGNKKMIVIENNSCPSGQKSMPLIDEYEEMGGYKRFVDQTILGLYKNKVKNGTLAVIYDKNYMEASGYAHALAEATKKQVHLIAFYNHEDKSHIRLSKSGYLEFFDSKKWIQLDFVFRYLTQKPWNRLPIASKTTIINPVITCLAGGRNKLVASKAYSFYNAELAEKNLKILTPQTIWDVNKEEIPLWIQKLGGKGVIKIPYSNAGQGVFTITSEKELKDFMNQEFHYEKFIVQSLIGNYNWSSTSSEGVFYHVGSMPNKKGFSYVLDFRIMVHATKEGLRPLSLYSRRALKPLTGHLKEGQSSWEILGTNLSIKNKDLSWSSDTSRLLVMERRGFNQLGISIDDLIEGFIQVVLSTIAIDKLAINLKSQKGGLKTKLFKSLNNDQILINEIQSELIKE